MTTSPKVPTRAAVVTARGRGAIAVVRVSGPAALGALRRVFRPSSRMGATFELSRPRVGRIGSGRGDEVVVIAESESSVEIQCHGGDAAIELVLEDLRVTGVEIVDPNALSSTDEPSQLRREAAESLARTTTLAAAEILIEQAAGALDCEISMIRRQLRESGTAAVEAARRGLRDLIERGRVGLKLETAWKVVLAGRPNVGKSSLLNALAGYERAIVHEQPGTTRDLVVARVACRGWPVDLCDTAGVRETEDTLEATGIERARRSHNDADLVVLLLDGSQALTEADRALASLHSQGLSVLTKCDLPWVWSGAIVSCMPVSAVTGEGVQELAEAIGSRLVLSPPPANVGIPFRQRHQETLTAALRSLEAGNPDEARTCLDLLAAGDFARDD